MEIDTSDYLTKFAVGFDGISDILTENVTVQEIILGESLLTPGLQTTVVVHSALHDLRNINGQFQVKNLDEFKNKTMNIDIVKPLLGAFANTGKFPEFVNNISMKVSQVTYRIDNRISINNNTEQFYIHACDQTLLDNAATLVSKFWGCTTPSEVVRDVLSSCAGAKALDIERSAPRRDYIAENIRPFQVVAQQANAALAAGNDPSFVHYMTYENFGTHKFRSLYSLTQKQNPIATYYFQELGYDAGHAFPYSILEHSFPCDFDLLSDILNGVGPYGNQMNTLFTFNPVMKMFNMFTGGSRVYGCGIGSGVPKLSMSNVGSAGKQGACPDYAHLYVHKRQARMGLLEQDKIALRITVPWNPILNAGKIITIKLPNKNDATGTIYNYGTGDYLIVSMKHHIKRNQPSTITMDCVSKTVGEGIV